MRVRFPSPAPREKPQVCGQGRSPRGFALMKQRWRALQHVTVSPTTIGNLAKTALVLVQFEHKMIS